MKHRPPHLLSVRDGPPKPSADSHVSMQVPYVGGLLVDAGACASVSRLGVFSVKGICR